MNKRTILIALLVINRVTAWATDFETATTAVANMKVGWNLGNTLDSNSGDVNNMWIEKWTSRMPSDYEKAWNQPVTKPELFKMFKDAGFNPHGSQVQLKRYGMGRSQRRHRHEDTGSMDETRA